MIPSMNSQIIVILIIGLLLFACDSKSPVQTADEISTANPQISGCGGFTGDTEKRTVNSIPFLCDPETYCDAEKLLWLYEESTQTLKVMNTRVLLNCCGDHEITAVDNNNVIIISENDQPEGGTGRCYCMCVYDFYIEISYAHLQVDLQGIREDKESHDRVYVAINYRVSGKLLDSWREGK